MIDLVWSGDRRHDVLGQRPAQARCVGLIFLLKLRDGLEDFERAGVGLIFLLKLRDGLVKSGLAEEIGVIQNDVLLTIKRIPDYYDNFASWTSVGQPMNAVQLFQKGDLLVFARVVDISFLPATYQSYFIGLSGAHGIARHFKISEIAAKYRLIKKFAADGDFKFVTISSCIDDESKLIAGITNVEPGTAAFSSATVSGNGEKLVSYTLPSNSGNDFGFYLQQSNPNMALRGKTFTCSWKKDLMGAWKIYTFYCGP